MSGTQKSFSLQGVASERLPNQWDLLALILVLAVIGGLAWGASGMISPYEMGDIMPVSLDPHLLPYYAVRSFLRMIIALVVSLLATFTLGTWAAKSRRAEAIIIPLIDVLQSVPVLSFLSISVVAFISLFRGSLLGPEFAAMFAIFTSQAWNMILSFYQSIATVPRHLSEAVKIFRLSPWQRFWRLEAPYAMPGLIWNMMLSMSASWFFVVASEAISVAGQDIPLPGIGSYIALAISMKNKHAVCYAIVAMLVVILIYDQLMFRPLNQWAERFYSGDENDDRVARPWVYSLFMRTRLFNKTDSLISNGWNAFVNWRRFNQRHKAQKQRRFSPSQRASNIIFYSTMLLGSSAIFLIFGQYIFMHLDLPEVWHVLWLGFLTALRVSILIVICSVLWVPIGVWIGLRPKWRSLVQPVVQFLAAFPANLLFPMAVILIVKYKLNVEIWTSPLMILGTQWYILFNVIAGTHALPKDLRQAAGSLGLKGWLWWKRFALPGIFPYFITGAIAAAGGAWNASIIAETVSWGNVELNATGLGAYITQFATDGDFARLALGTGMMCIYVLVINNILWRPLYHLAQERYQLN